MATQATDLELRIRAALDGIESVTGFKVELSNTGEAVAKLTQDASKLDSALEDLNGLRQQLDHQRELQARLNETSAALESAREKQRALSQQVVESFGPTQKQISEQRKAATEVQKLETRMESARERQRALTQQVIAADEPSASLTKRHEDATRRLEGLERALATARQRQEAANKAVADGGEPNDRLIRQHEKQTDTVESLEAELKNLQSQLQQNGQALDAAGVKTDQLNAASERIAQTFQEVTAKAKAFAEAQANLKFIPHEQLQREAQGLRDSYEVLRSSGKLSAQELAQANLKLQEGLLDLERRTNGWKDSLVKARVEIGAAIAAFAPIAISIKQASDFETALAGVRKVVDGTDAQFEGLTTRIRSLSRELPIAASGLAEIAAAGGQLGVPIDKLDQFIKLSSQVAVAFNLSAEQAGQAVAKLSNIFDIPLERVEDLGNAINVLGNTTAATEGQILDFLTRVGGSAKQFGLTAESVSALGASLIAMGRTPEVAATAVNALLVRLQAANVLAPKAKAALDGIGLSAEELARQIRENPQAALENFLGTLEKLDGQSRTEAIARILGVEQADKIASLVGNINQYRDALDRATDAQQTAGALQREFDAQSATTAQQYQLLKNVIGDIVMTIGTALLPAVKAAIAAGKEVAEAIAFVVEQAPGLSALAVTVVSLKVAMGGLNIAAAAARVAFTGMTASMTAGLTATATAATGATVAASGLGASLLAFAPHVAVLASVAFAVHRITQRLDELREAEEAARLATEQAADAEQRLATEIESRIRLNQKFTDQAILSSQDLAAKNREQLQAYLSAIDGARQYYQALEFQQRELGNADGARQAAEKVRELGAATEQAAAALARAQAQSASAAAGIVAEFAKATTAAEGTKNAINKVSDEALSKFKAQAAEALEPARRKLEEYEAQFASIPDHLLPEFELQHRLAFASAQEDVAALQGVLDTIRNEQFKRLGIDVGEVLTGIDAKAKAMLDTFRSLASDPQADPKLLTAAYQQLLKTLDNPKELEALRLSLAKVKAAGFDSAGAMAELEKKLGDVERAGDKAATALADAFKRAGIQTRAELEAAARQAEQDYALIAQSGQATAEGLTKAFARSAEAQLRLVDTTDQAAVATTLAMLRSKAATDEQRAAVEALAAQYVAKGEAARAAGDAAAGGSATATAALREELSAIDAVEAAYQARTKGRDGKGAQSAKDAASASSVASAGAVDPRYRLLTAEQRAEVDAFFNERLDGVLAARRRLDGALSGSSTAVPIEQSQLQQGVRELISQLLSGQTQPQPNRLVDINITLNGQRVQLQGTPAAAQQFEALLQQLARAAQTAVGT